MAGKPLENEEDDVRKERNRVRMLVHAKNIDKENFVAYGLNKKYDTAPVVKNLTFAIPENELFGLLGVNGAGKTTTFKMITATFPPSKGSLWVKGISPFLKLGRYRSMIGYCPQEYSILHHFTAREHLELFARLRSLPENQVTLLVTWIIEKVDLKLKNFIFKNFHIISKISKIF